MKVKWQREVFGRQPGQVEDIDPKEEPRLERVWLPADLCVRVGKAAKELKREDADG